jgi:hypothetical protein
VEGTHLGLSFRWLAAYDEFMSDAEHEKMKAWVANWKVVGEELDRLKWEELRAMDEADSARIFNKLGFGWVDAWTPPDGQCGFIIQQAIYSKAHGPQPRP